jgi:hypothetical protein
MIFGKFWILKWQAFWDGGSRKSFEVKTHLNVMPPINLTIYFLTLWNFIGYVQVSKRTWQNVQNSFTFYLQPSHMMSWDIYTSHNFQTLFAFLKFLNHLDTQSWTCLLVKDVLNFFWFHEKGLKIRINNINIIFHSFYSIIWITCNSNLSSLKNLLEMKVII